MKSYERANELSKVFLQVEAWLDGNTSEPLHITSGPIWDPIYRKALAVYSDEINALAFDILKDSLKQAKAEAEADLMSAQNILGAIKCE